MEINTVLNQGLKKHSIVRSEEMIFNYEILPWLNNQIPLVIKKEECIITRDVIRFYVHPLTKKILQEKKETIENYCKEKGLYKIIK